MTMTQRSLRNTTSALGLRPSSGGLTRSLRLRLNIGFLLPSPSGVVVPDLGNSGLLLPVDAFEGGALEPEALRPCEKNGTSGECFLVFSGDMGVDSYLETWKPCLSTMGPM